MIFVLPILKKAILSCQVSFISSSLLLLPWPLLSLHVVVFLYCILEWFDPCCWGQREWNVSTRRRGHTGRAVPRDVQAWRREETTLFVINSIKCLLRTAFVLSFVPDFDGRKETSSTPFTTLLFRSPSPHLFIPFVVNLQYKRYQRQSSSSYAVKTVIETLS